MGVLEIIVGIILFLLVLNLFMAFIPIPRGIGGAIVIILLIYLTWRLVF